MACSPQRAQAIHLVDEAWTVLIDRINRLDFTEVTRDLKALSGWKKNGLPAGIGPVTQQRVAEMAWLAMSEAAIRATEERNGGDDNGERIPCV